MAGCDCPHLASRELLPQRGGPRLAPSLPCAGTAQSRGEAGAGTSLAAPSPQCRSRSLPPGSCSRRSLRHLRQGTGCEGTLAGPASLADSRQGSGPRVSCRWSPASGEARRASRCMTGTLTDGTGASACVLLQQLDDVGLLGGRAAAADHGRALAGQLHELMLVVLQADLEEERGPGSPLQTERTRSPRARAPGRPLASSPPPPLASLTPRPRWKDPSLWPHGTL